MPAAEDQLLGWARDAVADRWPGAAIAEARALRGDASQRRFWRVRLESAASSAPSSLILADLGPDDLPRYVRVLGLLPDGVAEPPWINVHRFLSAIGAPVPQLFAYDAAHRAILIEDAGTTALFDLLRAQDAEIADWMRIAIENLFVLHVDGSRQIDRGCVARAISYDARLFRWELQEFVTLGCARVAPGADINTLAPELDALARNLGDLPRVFSHRDYHAHNLYARPAGIHSSLIILDFQDALMAPAAQDLAVLMTTRDTAALLPVGLEERLLQFYFSGLLRRDAAVLAWDDFLRSYRLCVLQHALKMVGRFILFDREGKTGYSRFVPYAAAQARRILNGPEGASFPRLGEAMREAVAGEPNR